mmetsp:Transcript_39087/g.93593  ORF Transcript_39087/g.93593 Transcript_39087/m.93593 type:complete len:229 (+) Transcript_39087:203-889(+)
MRPASRASRLTHRLIRTMVGLTMSCSPTPGTAYLANAGLGTSVPASLSSPVKNVMNTSRKKTELTTGTSSLARTCARTARPAGPPPSLRITVRRNLSRGIFFSSPDRTGARSIWDISSATHDTVRYFHPTANPVLGDRSRRFLIRRWLSLCLAMPSRSTRETTRRISRWLSSSSIRRIFDLDEYCSTISSRRIFRATRSFDDPSRRDAMSSNRRRTFAARRSRKAFWS